MGNNWFHEYFINELKAIGRKPTSNMQYEVVDSLPSSGNEQTIYFVKNDSSSTNDYYDEYVWISSSSTFEKIGGSGGGSVPKPLTYDYMPDGYPTKSIQPVRLLPLGRQSFTPDHDFYFLVLYNMKIVAGETYRVMWDGTEYERISYTDGNSVVIGNKHIMDNSADDTGEPFFIEDFGDPDYSQAYTKSDTNIHIIGISKETETITPMSYDYMPEGYPKKILTQKDLIEQQTMEFVYDPDFGASGTVALGSFKLITGGKYKVTINDKTYETIANLVTYEGMSFHLLGNGKVAGFEDTGESFGCLCYPQMMQIMIYDNVSQAIVGISGDGYDVVPMVPEFVGRAYDSAVMPTGVETILWDGTIDGNSDTFVWDRGNYYLVSNLTPSVSQLERSKIDDFEPYEVVQGTNACRINDDCIVVYSRGTCSLPVNDGDTAQTFYAEKPGIYMRKEGAPIKLEIPIYLKVPQIYGIIIKSSNSEKLFKITVDDTGTLSATEVT